MRFALIIALLLIAATLPAQILYNCAGTTVPAPTYNIAVTTSTGCTITPNGNVLVDSNATQAFTVSANTGYTLDSLQVDGALVDSTTSYTFEAVDANHTLRAYVHVTKDGNYYASPTGSSTGLGNRAVPWSWARARSALDADTTIVLLDGVYDVGNSLVTIGKGTEWCQLKADAGARPILTRTDGRAPGLQIAARTTLTGIWAGGKKDRAGYYGSSYNNWPDITAAAQDTFNSCVFFGYYNNLSASQYPVVVKNSLFGTMGLRYTGSGGGTALYHSIYFSGQPTCFDAGYTVYRNVVIASPSDSVGSNDTTFQWNGSYGIHFWHGADYAEIRKNWVDGPTYSLAFGSSGLDAGPGSDTAHGAWIRDNIFWGARSLVGGGLMHNLAASDSVQWFHNVFGPRRVYAGAITGTNTNVDSNYASDLKLESDAYPNSQAQTLWTYTSSTILNATPVSIDTASVRLARSFWSSKTAADVYADATIIPNWQILLNALDYWQGKEETPVYRTTPTIATNAATGIGATSATVSATVVPGGTTTIVRLLWGTSTGSYSDSSAIDTLSGWVQENVSKTKTSLTQFTAYYYRIAAVNDSGYTRAAEQTLTTTYDYITVSDTVSATNQMAYSFWNGGDPAEYTNTLQVYGAANASSPMQSGVIVTPNIPQGAVIDSAFLYLTTKAAQTGTLDSVYVFAYDDYNVSVFADGHGHMLRTHGTATSDSVKWTSTFPDARIRTADIKALVQIVVDNASWEANNNMGFFIVANDLAADKVDFETGAAYYPSLKVTYHVP